MAAVSPFLLPEEEYQQHIDPVKDWIDQSALYVAKMKGRPIEQVREQIVAKLKSGEIKINNPKVVHFERQENGDRGQEVVTLNGYIKDTIARKNILAPTFTTYKHPEEELSEIVGFLDKRVADRSRYKKMSAKFKAEGNTLLAVYYNNQQDSAKRTNNATSGSFVAEGSIINNRSAHSTLTSITRSIGSLSNASNERLIAGNRHYYTPQIALNNAISIISATNFTELQEVMDKYKLYYPTVEETMDVINKSLHKYTYDIDGVRMVKSFIEKCTPIERAVIVYNGDLYHLRQFNPDMIRKLIEDLARVEEKEYEDPIAVLRAADGLTINYAHQVSMSTVRGIGMDYSKIDHAGRCKMAYIAENIERTILEYKDFLRVFFLSRNVPCTIATLPNMVRSAVVLSDTDSTMFSVDDWVIWYFGKLDFSDRGFAIAGAVMYIATQCIAHILAIFSANMNVERKRLFTLAMKPEYCFPVFAQNSISKHYYTAMLVKEGNVYKDIEMEIKGVHNKDSTVPTDIITDAAAAMQDVIRTVMKGEKIKLYDYIKRAADIERKIITSLNSNEVTYLKRMRIKEAKSYKQEQEKSPYRNFLFWEAVFAKHYPAFVKPPYQAVGIPVKLKSKRLLANWIASIENKEIAAAMATWFEKTEQTGLTRFLIPIEVCITYGIPKELKPVIDYEKIILSLTKAHRNILESLGFFSKPEMLLIDQGY